MRWAWRFIRFLRGNCEVCDRTGLVSMSMLVPFFTGARTATGERHRVVLASRLSEVTIPCPHCTDSTLLRARVARVRVAALPDGAA